MRLLAVAMLIPWFGVAADYFVATNGLDNNPGSLSQPFRTLQRGAAAVTPGDTCFVRGGVYRETLTPVSSGVSGAPITFAAYSNEVVTVSATEVLSQWMQYSNHIYVAPMNWSRGDGFDQVFADGRMMTQARYPNTGLDPLQPVLAPMEASGGTLSCGGLNQPNDFWKGGTVVGRFGEYWTFQCAKITSSVPQALRVSAPSSPWFTGSGQGFVTGVLRALDTANEWHRQNGRLFFWPPGGDEPGRHLIEAKRRAWCVDFNQQSWIVVDGLRLFGGSVRMDGSHDALKNCKARYVSHFTYFPWSGYNSGGGAAEGHNGVYVAGDHNQITNCAVGFSAGSGIVINGTSNVVVRSVVAMTDYSGTYGCALSIVRGGGNRIWFNTMSDSGRDIIQLFGAEADDLRYNDLSRAGRLCRDVGITYQWGADGKGTRIAYNWIHDNLGGGQFHPGVYLDNWCRNFVVDHNVIWNCGSEPGIRINGPSSDHLIYNNTLFNCDDIGTHPYNCWPNNNPDPAYWTSNSYSYALANTLYLGSDPASQLVNYAARDFRLLPAAPGRNAGTRLPGYTDGFTGTAPDRGAYESGRKAWSAGTGGVMAGN